MVANRLLPHCGAGIVGVVQVVQGLAPQRGIDLLQVHHLLRRRLTEVLVRQRVRGDHMERRAVGLVVLEQLAAGDQHVAQLGYPVVVDVDADVCLAHEDEILGRVCGLLAQLFLGFVTGARLFGVLLAVRGQIHDLRFRQPHLDQL